MSDETLIERGRLEVERSELDMREQGGWTGRTGASAYFVRCALCRSDGRVLYASASIRGANAARERHEQSADHLLRVAAAVSVHDAPLVGARAPHRADERDEVNVHGLRERRYSIVV